MKSGRRRSIPACSAMRIPTSATFMPNQGYSHRIDHSWAGPLPSHNNNQHISHSNTPATSHSGIDTGRGFNTGRRRSTTRRRGSSTRRRGNKIWSFLVQPEKLLSSHWVDLASRRWRDHAGTVRCPSCLNRQNNLPPRSRLAERSRILSKTGQTILL